MTFLNGLLAFGALTLLIPLAIHLLHRRRFRSVDWGAMHLLDAVIQVNHRRMQWQQLVLLLVRCAIPVLLALCLSRPVLTMWRAMPGGQPTTLVLVVDDSYSTSRQQGAQTVLDGAIEQSRQIVAALPTGSEVMVLAGGSRPQALLEVPRTDRQQVERALQTIAGGAGSVNVAALLESTSVVLAAARHARRELVIVSDFQSVDWQTVSDAALRRARDRWQRLPLPLTVTLLPMVDAEPPAANVSVDDLQVDSETVAVGSQLRVRATMQNHSAQAFDTAKVRLLVDGQVQMETTAALLPAQRHQVLLTHTFAHPGWHALSVQVEIEDALAADNQRHLAVEVLESIDVLLVDGAPSDEPLQGESDYLVVAMSPFAFGQQPLADLLRARAVAAKQWKQDQTGTPRAVVLANVPRLEPWQVDWLRNFVHSGGGLMIFTGDQIDRAWYNATLGPTGADLLPMEIGEPREASADKLSDPSRASGTGRRIVSQYFQHPSMQLFNDSGSGNLGDASIDRWHPLQPFVPSAVDAREKPKADGPSATVVVRLDSDDPLMVERSSGDGVTMLVATAADTDGTNLPLRPFFVPLIQEWMTWLITRGAPSHNLQTGAAATARIPLAAADQPLQWWMPSGEQQSLQATVRANHAVVETDATRLQGLYILRGEAIDPILFAAQADSRESNLQRIDDQELQRVANLLDARVMPSADQYIAADRERRFGREIWRPLLWGLLSLMVLEMVLQQRFARVRQ